MGHAEAAEEGERRRASGGVGWGARTGRAGGGDGAGRRGRATHLQSAPLKPGSQRQTPLPPDCAHSPWPEQSFGQHLAEQSAPQKPSLQWHVPLKHMPLPEQSAAHVRSEQSKYVYPGWHSHWPSRQLPRPMQLFGHSQ